MKKIIACILTAFGCFSSSSALADSASAQSEANLVVRNFVTYAQGYCEGLREAHHVPFQQCLKYTVSLEFFLLEDSLQSASNVQQSPLPGYLQGL